MNAPVVVKLGSNLVVDPDHRPRWDLVNSVAVEVGAAVRSGTPVVIVSSGAIALGSPLAGLRSRRKLGPLQAASALGQAELQRLWHEAFAPLGLPVAQVLLTPVEITERRSYLNVGNALRALFDVPAVPILNENDATATDEISFGDNDVLAAQVAVLLRAARLFLLTSAGGVMSHPPGAPGATLVADGADLGTAILGPPTSHGSGGIESKIRASSLAAAGGVETVIASPADLGSLFRGEAAGTRFAPGSTDESAFKLWLRYGKATTSQVHIDAGAANAVTERGSSLLAVGVVSWSHDFRAGDGLDICHPEGTVIARGISSVDAKDVEERQPGVEVVHRDKLALVAPPRSGGAATAP
jgi:glutamate 5-kinase